MDYRKVAEEIYEKVGKKENLVSAAHCATRLRLVLVDNAQCDAKAVEEIDGVKGVFSASGQLQIILGTGTVNKVYDEFLAISGLSIFKNPLFTIKFRASIIPIKKPLATMAGIIGTKISPNVLIARL